MRTLSAVVHQDFEKYVVESDLSVWKETLGLVNTYASTEELGGLCNLLGERLEQETNDVAGAAVCYMCAANMPKTLELWEAYHVGDDESSALLDLMEKVIIFQVGSSSPSPRLLRAARPLSGRRACSRTVMSMRRAPTRAFAGGCTHQGGLCNELVQTKGGSLTEWK